MARIYDAVRSYFAGTDWTFEERPEEELVAFPVTGNNGNWLGFAKALEEEEQLVVHSVMPAAVPEERRESMALFLTRANFGTAIGNFELDLDDGEVRYKTSIDVEGSDIGGGLVRQLILANVVTTDFYLPGIEAVLAGADPALTIRELEGAGA